MGQERTPTDVSRPLRAFHISPTTPTLLLLLSIYQRLSKIITHNTNTTAPQWRVSNYVVTTSLSASKQCKIRMKGGLRCMVVGGNVGKPIYQVGCPGGKLSSLWGPDNHRVITRFFSIHAYIFYIFLCAQCVLRVQCTLFNISWLRCSLEVGYGSPDLDWELIAFVIIGLSTSREVASFNLPCIACRLMYLQNYLSFLTINPLWFGVFTSNIHLMKRSVGCRNIPLKWRFRPHPWWTTTSGRSHL